MIKLNLASGAHPLSGFINLDKGNGWCFEHGLNDYASDSVAGITESHGLMYVALVDWPFVFSEIARVLEPNGVVRITEDATDDPHSERYQGFHDAVTLTSFVLVADHLRGAGLEPYWVPPDSSGFRDDSLMQAHHGAPPKVFFIEALKP